MAQETSANIKTLGDAGFDDIQAYPAFGHYSIVTGIKP